VTVAVSDGLDISGLFTWVLATVIVWAAALLAGFILPAIFVKRAVGEARR
jgi:putative membrane protein